MKKIIQLTIIFCLGVLIFTSCKKEVTQTVSETTPNTVENTDVIKEPEIVDVKLPAVLVPKSVYNGTEVLWGYVDARQPETFIINPIYNTVTAFKNNRALVGNHETQGIINQEGKEIIPLDSFTYIQIVKENYYLATQELKDDTDTYVGTVASLFNQEGKLVFQAEDSNSNLIYNEQSQTIFYTDYATLLSYFDEMAQKMVAVPNGQAILQMAYDEQCIAFDCFQSELIPFLDLELQLYGYKNQSGEVVIQPQFISANKFYGEGAIVSIKDVSVKNELDETGEIFYGLINKKGEYLIEPNNFYIFKVTDDLYSVAKTASYWPEWRDMLATYLKKALYNSKGEQLTTFDYYYFKVCNDDFIVANNGNHMIFMNYNGQIDNQMPQIPFDSEVTIDEDFIICIYNIYSATNRNYVEVFGKNGKALELDNNSIQFEDGIRIKSEIKMPYYLNTSIMPRVTIEKNKDLESKINNVLQQNFGLEQNITDIVIDGEITSTNDDGFEVIRNHNVLSFVNWGYWYGMGAHGQSYQSTIHIDAITGEAYSLKDLFKKESPYTERIAQLVSEAYRYMGEDYLFYNDEDTIESENLADYFMKEDYKFNIVEGGIEIYYDVYEIGPYVVGMPSFYITFEDLNDILDQEGDFYKSLGL